MIAFDSNASSDAKPNEEVPPQYWEEALHRPVREFMQRQGKRIRSDLVDFAYSASSGSGKAPCQVQEFVELMHAGSLIVDDVEDGAETRRSLPSLHRIIGIPLAINTGNWMYFAALEKLIDLPVGQKAQAAILKRSIATVRKCHEGQALDLATKVTAMNQREVVAVTRAVSRLKTGGLVSLAAWLGAAVAGAKPELRRALSRFGMQLGIALQMQNDLAELRMCAVECIPSNDLENARVTWPWAWAAEVCNENEFSQLLKTENMAAQSSSLFVKVRRRGSDVVNRKLQQAFSSLRNELGSTKTPRESCRILERLERYHV